MKLSCLRYRTQNKGVNRFKHTVQVWVAWSGRQFLSEAQEDIGALFGVIAPLRVGKRPGRLEPRAVKQRPKAFARLHTIRRHG